MKKRIISLFLFILLLNINNSYADKEDDYYNVKIISNVNPQKNGNVGFTLKKIDDNIKKYEDIKKNNIEFTSSQQYLNNDGTLSLKLKEGNWLIEQTYISNNNYIESPSDPVLVKINDNKDIEIKNDINDIEVYLYVKDDKGKPVNDLEFTLYNGSPGNSTKMDNYKVESGILKIKNLSSGYYYLVQNEDEDYIRRYDTLNNNNNILRFSLDDKMNLNTSTDFNNFIVYSEPIIKKSNIYKEEGYFIKEKIPVDIKIDIPKNIKDYSKFYLTETIEQNKELTNEAIIDKNSIKVLKNGKPIDDKKYEINIEDNKFTINFLDISDQIEIKYQLSLKENVSPTVNIWPKTEVDYNNSPDSSTKDVTLLDEGNSITTYAKKFILDNTNDKFLVRKKNEELYLDNNYKFTENINNAKVFNVSNKELIINGLAKDEYLLYSSINKKNKKFKVDEYSHIEQPEKEKNKNNDEYSLLILLLIIFGLFWYNKNRKGVKKIE